MTIVFKDTTAPNCPQHTFSPAQFQSIREALQNEGRLVSILPILGVRTEEQAYQALTNVLRLRLADLAKSQIDVCVLELVPLKLVHRYAIFPLGLESNGSLLIATSNPLAIHALDSVSAATGRPVVPVVALPTELGKLIKSHIGVGAETVEGLMAQDRFNISDEFGVEVLDDLDWEQSGDAGLAQEASVIRLVNEILSEAVEVQASDIHIEARETGMRIRYRIDGVLQTQPMPLEINRFQSAIVSRLKIMARLNIAEKRIPQDGRIKLKVSGREIDLRLSVIPMLHGEGIVMRILDKDRMEFTLRGIGMDADIYEQFGKLIKQPHGIILVTGPTGSGKTTTLYSALNEIKSDATKIITTEDPIEYQLDGVNQIQVHSKVGLTFAASLRAVLRHDPDVVLVGEIRDLETAENAIQASLTGHLVFSTLHTNDAAGAFTRLNDMGVEPFLIGTTVEGVMAQRLVRRLCTHCKEKYEPALEELPKDFPMLTEPLSLDTDAIDVMPSADVYNTFTGNERGIYRPVGCTDCRHTGYSGRIALYELLIATEPIRLLANGGRHSHEIKAAARKAGMQTLRENGWRKVLQGLTSIDEVIRMAKED